jgi:hypothetical protein
MTLFPITFSNFFPAFLSALFTAGSLYAMGRLLLGALGANRFGHHVALAIGFGINHLVFLSASLVMDGPAAVLFMNLLHAAFLGFYLMSRGRNALPTFRLEPLGTVLMLVVLLPYVFRLFSPPMNVDGLMFYLPNVEWVYHRGLAFNPHLTAYTTMPMAAEYLFAQAYGLGFGMPVRHSPVPPFHHLSFRFRESGHGAGLSIVRRRIDAVASPRTQARHRRPGPFLHRLLREISCMAAAAGSQRGRTCLSALQAAVASFDAGLCPRHFVPRTRHDQERLSSR